MNWIAEAPKKNERRHHDDLVRVVNTVVKRQSFADRNCDDTFDRWMPVDASDCSLFTELQISERLKLLRRVEHAFADISRN